MRYNGVLPVRIPFTQLLPDANRRSFEADLVRMLFMTRHYILALISLFVLSLTVANTSNADQHQELAEAIWAERVEFTHEGQQRVLFGDVVVEATDGGVLLQAPNQQTWPLQPDQIISRSRLDERPKPLTTKQLAQSVLQELPGNFRVHTTKHYVICYNTSDAYAQWCGALFERLHRAFNNYWSRRGLKLKDAPPLIACVFRDRESFYEYGKREHGKAAKSWLGYYSYETNRIAMYDLLEGRRTGTAAQVNQLMRQERTVATIIHEATHQLAFNSGLHQRHADIPVWLSEGLAVFFETPDLKSTRGWKTIGAVNRVQLAQFRSYTTRRQGNSLRSLLATDERYMSSSLKPDAYAESWAFCYYLIRHHPRKFADYLKLLQKKPPSEIDTPQVRLDDFAAAFGKSPLELEEDFMKSMSKVR